MDPSIVTVYVILGGLVGTLLWVYVASYKGIAVSASHSLIGGFVGAALAKAGIESLKLGGVSKVLIFIIVAPLLGMIGGFLFFTLIMWIFRKVNPHKINKWFRRLQLISASSYAITHGANDGQKTMGIIVLILFSAGMIPELEMPLWVIVAAATAMGLGTFFGGYKVIKTLGVKITKLKPYQGFAAETGGGLMLAVFAIFGIPASTTHAITGTIMGAGAARRKRAVRWKVSRQIIFSWVITIPGSAAMGAAFTYLIYLFV